MFFLHWVEYHSTIASFDLWMFEKTYDVFALIIDFWGNEWQPKHVTIGLFEATKTTRQNLARNLIKLNVSIKFAQVNLQKCIIWPKILGKGKIRIE